MNKVEKCKDVYNKCLRIGNQYLQQTSCMMPQIVGYVKEFHADREEFSINSRYMHRGFYCPSLDLEHIVTNMRRGTIAKRISLRSNLTNCYMFDKNGNLRIVQTYYPNDSFDTEYIFSEDNTVCGVTFDSSEQITALSIEEYVHDRLVSYLWCACCSVSGIYWMIYEVYDYEINGCLETEIYDMNISEKKFCSHKKCRFQLDKDNKILRKSAEILEDVRIFL